MDITELTEEDIIQAYSLIAERKRKEELHKVEAEKITAKTQKELKARRAEILARKKLLDDYNSMVSKSKETGDSDYVSKIFIEKIVPFTVWNFRYQENERGGSTIEDIDSCNSFLEGLGEGHLVKMTVELLPPFNSQELLLLESQLKEIGETWRGK